MTDKPADGGEDLKRLVQELKQKGWQPEQLQSLQSSWEAACHDPMRRGRGGPSLPENAGLSRPRPDTPPPAQPPEAPWAGASEERKAPWSSGSDLAELLGTTVPWQLE